MNTVNAQTTLSGNAGANPQLRVENSATVQNAFGVLGRITAGSPAAQTAGVRGINSGTNANGFGVWGFHQGSGVGVFGETGAGTGVVGKHTNTSGAAPGVLGETASTARRRGRGAGPGLRRTGQRESRGRACSAPESSAGMPPAGGIAPGVQGETLSLDPNAVGVLGKTSPGATTNSIGVMGITQGTSGCIGVKGIVAFLKIPAASACSVTAAKAWESSGTATDQGVSGGSSDGFGVLGSSIRNFGGAFTSFESDGLTGRSHAANGTGVIGEADDAEWNRRERIRERGASAVGVLGQSSTGLAGKFEGHLHTTGRITKAYTSGSSSQAVPIAYGTVRATDGLLLSGTPNVSGSYDATNHRYVVTIANETYATASYITTVTPTSSAQPRFATTSASSGKLLVRIFDADGGLQQAQFSFVTYKV